MRQHSLMAAVCLASALLAAPPLYADEPLVTGLQGASGSTVGPDGALYVTEGIAGRVLRVDPKTGATEIFAEGLPVALIGIGGAIDIAFLGKQAYVLVTLVGAPFGPDVNGLYRIDGRHEFEIVADLGKWSEDHPPETSFDLAEGVQYALEPYRGGLLVTDGHLNRVLFVDLGGISEIRAFDNIVPTGLETWGNAVLMAEAGEVPHLPEDGRIVAFMPRWPFVFEIASGAPLLVDVEFGRGRTLYALSQGSFPTEPPYPDAGAPAIENTGALLKVEPNGSLSVVEGELNQPTSVEIIGDTAYVVTLPGEIITVDLERPRPPNDGQGKHGGNRKPR